MLSFLSPAFLIGSAVAALPIVLHLLGRRPRLRVLFPAVRLLKRAPAQETRRRRLRELLLLALRVSAVCLLALAFARPYLARPARMGARAAVVVAIDRSFSMSAPGQFDRARGIARHAVTDASPGAPVGLLAFDDEAHVLVKPGGDRTAVLNALARLQPGYGGTSYATALARGAEALGPAGGRIVIVTDLQRAGWDRQNAAIGERVDVDVRDTGGPASNLAVSDLHPGDNGLTALIRNSGAAKRTGRARLAIGGRLRAVMPFVVDASSVQQITFPGRLPATGEAGVDIDDGIGYQADNRAYALLDPPEPPALLAVTGQADPSRGAFYLQRALEVDNGRLFRVDSEPAATLSARLSAQGAATGGRPYDRYAAVFLLGTRGLSAPAANGLADYVARGGGLFVALDDQVEPAAADRILGSGISLSFQSEPRSAAGIVPADARHPVLALLEPDAFASVHVERVARADVQPGKVLARFGDGTPALVEQRRGAGRVLLFGSDVSNRWNDLPLQPAFLPLVHQVARYLAGDRLPARDFFVAAAPDGIPRQPGIVSVPAAAGGTEAGAGRAATGSRIVLNIDPRESDVSRMTATEFGQMIVRSGGGGRGRAPVDPPQAEQQQALWRVAIALAIVVLLGEGLLGKAARV